MKSALPFSSGVWVGWLEALIGCRGWTIASSQPAQHRQRPPGPRCDRGAATPWTPL
jgi:hypothetical protein